MTTAERSLSSFAHLHDMNGNIIHKHARGVTLGFFFRTLGMKFNSTCLEMDDGSAYCSNKNAQMKVYVNGRQNSLYDRYEFEDLDRILVVYGDETPEEIRTLGESITSDACIYSLKCPERGTPPDEATCVGSCVLEEL